MGFIRLRDWPFAPFGGRISGYTRTYKAISRIAASGRIPLLVGGTMLYFRVLQRGLAQLPDADPEVRAELDRRAAREGWPALHGELARHDPQAAARIHSNDMQRIQRALEVYYLAGRPLSELQRESTVPDLPFRLIKLAVAPGRRAVAHERIEHRFRGMMARGFLEEVARLRGREDLHRDMPAMRAVGYRQLWEHLDGDTDCAEAVRRGIVATRRLAKRQMTWLRAETGAIWSDSLEPGLQDHIFTTITSALG